MEFSSFTQILIFLVVLVKHVWSQDVDELVSSEGNFGSNPSINDVPPVSGELFSFNSLQQTLNAPFPSPLPYPYLQPPMPQEQSIFDWQSASEPIPSSNPNAVISPNQTTQPIQQKRPRNRNKPNASRNNRNSVNDKNQIRNVLQKTNQNKNRNVDFTTEDDEFEFEIVKITNRNREFNRKSKPRKIVLVF